MERDDIARKAALRLIAQGLITPAQAADLAGVSRQLVNYWLRQSGIKWQATHRARLTKMWLREVNKRK